VAASDPSTCGPEQDQVGAHITKIQCIAEMLSIRPPLCFSMMRFILLPFFLLKIIPSLIVLLQILKYGIFLVQFGVDLLSFFRIGGIDRIASTEA
jgi:hypothetical protein